MGKISCMISGENLVRPIRWTVEVISLVNICWELNKKYQLVTIKGFKSTYS